jgi:hypothetical protein
MLRLFPYLTIQRFNAFNDFRTSRLGHGLSRQMSRVKPQKSLGKSDIVTVSRVKTPGEVDIKVGRGVLTAPSASARCALRRPCVYVSPVLTLQRFNDLTFQRANGIRGYSRLFAVIRTYSRYQPPSIPFQRFNDSTIQRLNAEGISSYCDLLRPTASKFDLQPIALK